MRGREAFAKLVLRARAACRTNALGAENSPRCSSVQDAGDSPKLLRGRSAALSRKLRDAERSAEPRGEGTNALGAENSPRYYFCTGCWRLAISKTPPRPLRGAAPGSGGTRKIPRNRAGKRRGAPGARTMYAPAGAPVGGRCGTFRVAGRAQMKIEAPNEDRWGILTIKGVRAGSSRENRRFCG